MRRPNDEPDPREEAEEWDAEKWYADAEPDEEADCLDLDDALEDALDDEEVEPEPGDFWFDADEEDE